MANLKIEIRDGKLKGNNGINVEAFCPDYAQGNGWKVFLNRDGDLYCYATHVYKGIRHQCKFSIVNARGQLLLITGNKTQRILAEYNIPRWPVDGTLHLPGGPVEQRRPHFVEKELQDFMNKHKLWRVCYEPADGYYNIIKTDNGNYWEVLEGIETDGVIVVQSQNHDEQNKTIRQVVKVSHATWVIKSNYNQGKVVRKIIYTNTEPTTLVIT
jgi:hypothetical protein